MLGGRKLASSSHLLLLISMTIAPITPGTAVQFCGNDLSDAIALVCAETGYNMPHLFHSDSVDGSSDRRYPREAGERHKRGIVDECCRSPCGWATIETYCRPQPSSTSSENLQIQKRSDPPSDAAFKEQVEAYSISRTVDQGHGSRHQKRRLFSQAEDAVVIKNNRQFHSVVEDQRRPEVTITSNKVKRNDKRKSLGEEHKDHKTTLHNTTDTEEKKVEELKEKFRLRELQYLQIRHHRANKSHHKDLKKGKSAQVGTVSPYYFGKFLVSPKARRLPY
uniref:Insulin-like growth factor I n=1 Tax=Lygus hesperus TaxID=30085 RepID=A0A146M6K1_LYGHE